MPGGNGENRLKPILCLNCKWQKDGRCTQFDFKADMRTWKESAWCKSGEPVDG